MHWSKEQFKEYLIRKNNTLSESPKKQKYNARKTKVDGITFDSKHEASGYLMLRDLKKNDKIQGFCIKPTFMVGKEISWKPDFMIVKNNGKCAIIEYKGFETEDFKIKKKLFIEKFPDLELLIVKEGETILDLIVT